MDAKLRIDLIQGIVEVEGSEELVTKVYDDFKQKLASKPSVSSATSTSPKPEHTESIKGDAAADRTKARRKVATSRKTLSLVRDLDLSGKDKAESLKSFVGKYVPKSAMEWNLLFVYCLQKIIGVPEVGMDHVYTCYKHVNEKTPSNLYQSLMNTAHKKGYINTDSIEKITVTVNGENYIEHDMPKKGQPNEGTSQ